MKKSVSIKIIIARIMIKYGIPSLHAAMRFKGTISFICLTNPLLFTTTLIMKAKLVKR